jgi:hypothetical protein
MKKRVFLMSLSLFVMAPAVFGAELGLTMFNSEIPSHTRACSEDRDAPRSVSAVSGGSHRHGDDGVRVGYGESASER